MKKYRSYFCDNKDCEVCNSEKARLANDINKGIGAEDIQKQVSLRDLSDSYRRNIENVQTQKDILSKEKER
jgi:hypothetical protein